jgi:peroxiredoxin
MLQPGDALPGFELRDADREVFTDEDLRGVIAVMAFYPMSFTGG